MKTRIFTVILCAIMLVCTIFSLSGCGDYVLNRDRYVGAKAYVFFPNGKMQVYGDCEDLWFISGSLVAIEIDGHVYFTSSNLINIDAIMK